MSFIFTMPFIIIIIIIIIIYIYIYIILFMFIYLFVSSHHILTPFGGLERLSQWIRMVGSPPLIHTPFNFLRKSPLSIFNFNILTFNIPFIYYYSFYIIHFLLFILCHLLFLFILCHFIILLFMIYDYYFYIPINFIIVYFLLIFNLL